MAWTAPMTAVAGNVFTAAQFNANVRDNLLETAAAKATVAGRYMATAGVNSLVERVPTTAEIATSEVFSSSTFGDLATPGPTVTVTTGANAMVWWGCSMSNNQTANFSIMGVAVSGATTIAANDTDSFNFRQATALAGQTCQGMYGKMYTALTPGVNTFTCKYRHLPNATGQSTFLRRRIFVLPF